MYDNCGNQLFSVRYNQLRKASPLPNTSHSISSMLLSRVTPHIASLNDPEAGLGLCRLGEGPSSGLQGRSKSESVLDSWLLICV
jgi:hypothetical protein